MVSGPLTYLTTSQTLAPSHRAHVFIQSCHGSIMVPYAGAGGAVGGVVWGAGPLASAAAALPRDQGNHDARPLEAEMERC